MLCEVLNDISQPRCSVRFCSRLCSRYVRVQQWYVTDLLALANGACFRPVGASSSALVLGSCRGWLAGGCSHTEEGKPFYCPELAGTPSNHAEWGSSIAGRINHKLSCQAAGVVG